MTSVLEQLPKPGWWKAGVSYDAMAEELRRVNRILQSVQDPVFGSFPWTHDVIVESAETDPPGYYCGQACCVESTSPEWLRIVLAIWWTGARSTMNIRYRPVPSKFALVPFLQPLGKQVLDIVVAAGFERVEHGFKRPGGGKFWLGLDTEQQCVQVQFHTPCSGNRAFDELVAAGIVCDTSVANIDIVVRPNDNILR